MKRNFKAILGLIIILGLFLGSSLISERYESSFEGIENSLILIGAYFVLMTLSTILGPVSGEGLIPLASNLWGWFFTGIITLIAWTIGSTMIFWISRKFGRGFIKKFKSMEELEKYEKKIPRKHKLLGIIGLRIFLPFDILSYALGLFSGINIWTYVIATFIGYMPLAFLLSKIGSLPIEYQIVSILFFGVVGVATIIIYIHWRSLRSSK